MLYDAFWHASLTLSHISLDFIRFLGSLLHSKSALAAREHTIWVRSFYSLSFLHFLPEWDRIYGQTKLLDVLERKTMARPLRVNLPGGYYHVTCRRNERKEIFSGDEWFVSEVQEWLAGGQREQPGLTALIRRSG